MRCALLGTARVRVRGIDALQKVVTMNIRKKLSASGLFKLVQVGLEKIKDVRTANRTVSLADGIMSAFAIFSLKEPSLLAFDERKNTIDGNLKRLYGIKTIPCEPQMRTQMRTILDEVDPEKIRPLYKDIFRELQRATSQRKVGVYGRQLPL